MVRATGPFDVKMTPEAADSEGEGSALGRMALAKTYHGDLDASARGTMLTAGTGVAGSGAYVAVERVSGTLHGRRGTFALQHMGTMTRGEPSLSISVVPDSGTGELTGLTGRLGIVNVDGKHTYELEYALSAP